jgi:hypothetical protein
MAPSRASSEASSGDPSSPDHLWSDQGPAVRADAIATAVPSCSRKGSRYTFQAAGIFALLRTVCPRYGGRWERPGSLRQVNRSRSTTDAHLPRRVDSSCCTRDAATGVLDLFKTPLATSPSRTAADDNSKDGNVGVETCKKHEIMSNAVRRASPVTTSRRLAVLTSQYAPTLAVRSPRLSSHTCLGNERLPIRQVPTISRIIGGLPSKP